MSTYSLNKNSLSVAIGLTNNVTIGRIINENRHPSQKTLQMILTKFSNIDANWLFTGEGGMYKSDFNQEAESILLDSLSNIDNSKNVGSNSKKMSVQMSGDNSKNVGSNDGCINSDEDLTEYKTISVQIVDLLLKETKELNQEVGSLKHENAQLRAENGQLRAELAECHKGLKKPA